MNAAAIRSIATTLLTALATSLCGWTNDRSEVPPATRGAQSAPLSRGAAQPGSVTVERVTIERARTYLWPVHPPDTHACDPADDPIVCMLAMRWSVDAAALATVTALWHDLGIVCGVERAFVLNGAYRGMVSIVPQMPLGRYAPHLALVDRALRDQDAFYRSIAARASRAISYRWTGIGIRFFRSANTHTPAGYAEDLYFAYNVVGGINDTLERIRLTIIHEVFHLNDAIHQGWSHTALEPIYRDVLGRCGHNVNCLRPYAPVLLRVRRTGMFYAFQSGNSDVGEYAAMLAERYYLEQSGQWTGAPFRCASPQNAAAWHAIAEEFFGGYETTVECPAH